MLIAKEHTPMKKEEILELLRLRGWNRERLAVEMCVSVAAIHKWIREGECPKSPASVLMGEWLERARAEAGRQAVPA